MRALTSQIVVWGMLGTVLIGCRSTHRRPALATVSPPSASIQSAAQVTAASFVDDENPSEELAQPPSTAATDGEPNTVEGDAEEGELVNPEARRLPAPDESSAEPIAGPPDSETQAPSIERVVASVRNYFPVVQQAIAGRTIASGEVLSAFGAFDHKLDGFSQSQPLDFYENYRHGLGVKRDTMWGGQVFAGYRNGRGIFEPWYLERETNKGGEFKVGFMAPIVRDRVIDANRAELWRAQLERDRVEPEILAVVIGSVREGSFAYWDWVAAGVNLRITESVLELGLVRENFLRDREDFGAIAEIDLVDNRRIIVSRQAKVTDARRKLEQTAQKLSLFLRDETGRPILLPSNIALDRFPPVPSLDDFDFERDRSVALANRPELVELNVVREQLNVALRQARNETIPDVDAGILLGQDVGEPTSSKRDKSELELEATVTLSVPLQRRKALGKIRQLSGKLAELQSKLQFAEEKIVAEVGIARAALIAAAQRVEQTTEGLELALRMQRNEQENYRDGATDLLTVNIRENQAADAALAQLAAQLEFYLALADYVAALGYAGE